MERKRRKLMGENEGGALVLLDGEVLMGEAREARPMAGGGAVE
jgi:hypothetical protein